MTFETPTRLEPMRLSSIPEQTAENNFLIVLVCFLLTVRSKGVQLTLYR